MVCKKCNAEIVPGARFCSRCGTAQDAFRKKETVLKEMVARNESDPEEVYQAHAFSLCTPNTGVKFPVSGHGYYVGIDGYGQNYCLPECEYKEMLYYVKFSREQSMFLCSSDLVGNAVRIVADLSEIQRELGIDYSSVRDRYHMADCSFRITANKTGIYVYAFCDFLAVWHYGFDGNMLSKFREEYDGKFGHAITSVDICEDKVYYIHEHCEVSSELRCVQMEEGVSRLVYDKAKSLTGLTTTDNQIVFWAEYGNEKGDARTGWMLLDLKNNTVESLDNPYCNPENILDCPSVYDDESPDYNENCNGNASAYYGGKIFIVDLSRQIFWVYRQKGLCAYLEPRELKGKHELAEWAPFWKVSEWDFGYIRYFDGFAFYLSRLYDFLGLQKDGNSVKWYESQNQAKLPFSVVGDKVLVLMDKDDAGNWQGEFRERMFERTYGKHSIADNWMDMKEFLPNEILAEYRHEESGVLNCENEFDEFEFDEAEFDEFDDFNDEEVVSLKIGKLAQNVFGKMLEEGKASPEEIRLMQQKAYSKEIFDLRRPVLVKADSEYEAKRYYAKPLVIYGTSYKLCSQWFETAAQNNRPYLEKWIENHK